MELEKINKKDFWNETMGEEKLLTDEEAEKMIKITKKFRKERGFRE
jgi:hypothetical protein